MVDIATGWSERVAILGRSGRAVSAGLDRALEQLPFAIKQLHPDNGGEFFNDHPIRYLGEGLAGMGLSRSHPYQENGNRVVGRKNHTPVRAYAGRARPDTPERCERLNGTYEPMWACCNLFQPALHLGVRATRTASSRSGGIQPRRRTRVPSPRGC
jgi:hypothetical protein